MIPLDPDRPNDALEILVDANGLRRTLEQLAEVCRDKADHLAHAWQSGTGAKAWTKASRAIDRLAAKLPPGL